MSAGPISIVSELAVLTQPFQKTMVYAVWYATLMWIPIRLMAALIDRRKSRVEQVIEVPVADDSYRVGMPILPPL